MTKFLITNDDGVSADGIVRLAALAKEYGEVWVVAPDGQRSAMSHSITLRYGFDAWPVDFPVEGVHAWACSGTPADCARIGILNIVPGKPDYLLSGINYGHNVAVDIQYSATDGAAFEGAFQGIPSIAFSEDMCENHEVTDRYLRQMLLEAMEIRTGWGQIVNVNFPGCPVNECRGIQRNTKASRAVVYRDIYDETPGENGRITYKVNGLRMYQAETGTDLRAVSENFVSIGLVSNIS